VRAAGEPADVAAATSFHYDPHAARRADALAHLAEQYLAHEPVALKQGDRHQVVVHVERGCLHADGEGGRCELEEGPALAAEAVRRLACDAAVVEIEEDEHGTPLDIGRKTRTVPPALRRALQSRDRGCRFPGCTHTRYVDAHHVQHWADGGGTSLDNLLLLCRRHHRALHEGGYTLARRDDHRLLFLTPQGELVPEVPEPVLASEPVEDLVRRAGFDVSAETCVPYWYAGDSLNLGMAVEGFLQADGRLGYPVAGARCTDFSP